MASVSVSTTVQLERAEAWALMSDLSRLGEWLELHEDWRSDVPQQLVVGTELASIVSFKGIRNRVAWTIEEFDPPQRLRLAGDGKGGTSITLDLAAIEAGPGQTEIDLSTDFTNPALAGPVGRLAARSLKGALEKSIKRLASLTP